jgi:hypothetical protein
MAHPTHSEIAEHREQVSWINDIIARVEQSPEDLVEKATTSLESEKKKWGKKLKEEQAKVADAAKPA